MTLESGLKTVMGRVTEAAARSGRRPDDVTVVAVSKGRTAEMVMALHRAGHRHFGENRAAELAEKAAVLPSDIQWHFVGHLQSNKARTARPTTAVLHSLDRVSLAKAWLKGSGQAPPAYLEVNIGREEQKSGVDPDEAVATAQRLDRLGIDLIGLMAIIPLVDKPEQARPYFRRLAELRNEVRNQVPSVTGLSMGMTDDFEVAVEEGATVIRVGRAIFDADHDSV